MADETMVDPREIIARQLCSAAGHDPEAFGNWHPATSIAIGPLWHGFRDGADKILAALKDSGMVIVPVEPTEAMLQAAYLDNLAATKLSDKSYPHLRRSWAAMIKSFLPTQEQEG